MGRYGPILAGVVAAFALASDPAAWAQVGSLRVTVFEKTAASRQSIPGATVELENPERRFPPQSRQTDLDGTALFADVPAGRGYVVTVIAVGYNGATQPNVQVVPGKTTPLAVLMLRGQEEELTVTGRRPVVELGKTESTTSISGEFFNDLPVYGRDYQNVLSLAPGVNDADGDGNVTVHGSRERDFKVTIDGVSNVDPLTGQRLSQINPDAIEEIEIIDTGADLSMGGAVGGFARVIIKSGGNEFEGSTALYWVDATLNNDGAGNRDPAPFTRRKPSIYVSGPIVKDHLWYMLSAEATQASTPINVIGGADVVEELRSRTEVGKLTWQVNNKNRLAVQYSADPLELEPSLELNPSEIRSLATEDAARDYRQGGPTYSLKWTATTSPSSSWESTLAFSNIEYGYEPHNRLARNACATGTIDDVDVTGLRCTDAKTGFITGAYPRDYNDTRQRRSYGLDATKYFSQGVGGTHDVKYGMLLERTFFERDLQARTILFKDSLPQQFIISPGGSTGGIDFQRLPSSRLQLTQYFPSDQTNSVQGNNLAFYITDSYQPASNLTLSVGLRLNREELSADGFTPFDPQRERVAYEKAVVACIAAGNDPSVCVAINSNIFTAAPEDDPARYPACSVALNPRQCTYLEFARSAGRRLKFRTPESYTVINNNLSRALSATWDPAGTGRSQITASYTRLYGDAFFEPFVTEQGPSALTTAYDLNQDDEVLTSLGLAATGKAFQISQLDRNINSPYQDEIVLGFEREIASETGLRFRYINRHYEDQYQDTDINHMPVFFNQLTPRQLSRFERCNRIGEFADCTGQSLLQVRVGGPPGSRPVRYVEVPDGLPDLQVASPLFNNVYLIGNFNASTYEAVVFELERRFYQNWETNLSYTWSRSFGQAEDFSQDLGNDATNTDDERGPLATDQTHVVKLNGRVLVNKWGGFRLGANVRYASGLPYSITSARAVLDFPTDLTGAAGANKTELFETQRNVFPTGQRNDRRNSATWNVDVNFQKEFKLNDGKGTFQVSAFNLLNAGELLISGVQRGTVFTAERAVSQDKPTATRPIGRYFEVAFKLNF